MKKLIYTFLAALMVSCSCGQLEVKSPDTQNKLAFQLSKEGQLTYTIDKGQESIIIPSAMGYILKDGTKLDGDFKLLSTATDTFSEEWQTIWGEDETVLNHYNELTLNLEHKPSGIKLNIIARAFNDGVAFRYVIPKQDKLGEYVIMDELTEFNFPGDYKTWWGYADYDNYEKTVYNSPISEIGNIEKYARRKDKEEMERRSLTPMTVEVNDNLAVSIHEAHLVDYPDMSIERMGDGIVLKSHLTPWMNGDAVRVSGEMVSPWRTFTMGTAAQLVESKMLVNLNPPCAYEDTDWIKTFKYIGIWWELHIGKTSWAEKVLFGQPLPKNRPHGATTENAKMHIDFAAKHGFEEVLVEGWDKGWDDMTGSWTGYGIFDWKTPTDDYDLVEVCRYAKEKGVRIMMYVETISDIDHLEPAMDDLFKMYQDLGITTVKMGYTGDVNYDYETKKYRQHHHGQYMVRHYNKMIRTAAKYNLMIVNHEPIKYTGEQRTYPNIMAREGAKGQEYNAWSAGNAPEHAVALPFTRLLSGPMDYTPGIFNMKVRSKKTSWADCSVKSTICKELAFYLTMYSPIQMAADLPANYEGVPALEFIKCVPTNWSRSKVLHAKIGDYYTVVRQERGTDNWYLGSVTDENSRTLDLDLSFLKPDTKYVATIYADGEDAHWDENPAAVDITTREVTSSDKMQIKLAPGGGQAIAFVVAK